MTTNKHKTLRTGSAVIALVCTVGMFSSAPTHATGIGLGATRLVFNAQAGQTTVSVRNTAAVPYLVTSRLSRTLTGKENTPFFVSPPLLRLEGGSSTLLRITGNTSALPQDRESVFFLTVTGVAPSNPLSRESRDGFSAGGVVYAVGNTIKLFYRPNGLPSSAAEAAKALRFTRAGGQVRAENHTPYYVSLMTLNINGRAIRTEAGKSDMIAPFGTASWAVGAPYPMSQADKVSWAAMVNLGEVVNGSATLQ